MSGGFGRKGVDHAMDAASAPTLRQAQSDGLSPAARAFLAADRAQRAPEPDDRVRTDAAFASAIAAERSRPRQRRSGVSDRSMFVAYVLWWFSSPIAAHRFYLRHYSSAWAMLGLFIGGFALAVVWPPLTVLAWIAWFLWVVVDAFKIPGMTRTCNGPGVGEVFA